LFGHPGLPTSRWRALVLFGELADRRPMTDPTNKLTLTEPRDLAEAIAFALRFEGRKRVHNADEIMAEIVAKRLVEHLERAGSWS
jgi:hypothetical protein